MACDVGVGGCRELRFRFMMSDRVKGVTSEGSAVELERWSFAVGVERDESFDTADARETAEA